MVRPNVLPFPLGRAVITRPVLSQLTDAFQVAMTRWGERRVTVTTQLFVPLTVMEPLKRSDHCCPAVYVVVQLPPLVGGGVVGGVVGLPPPSGATARPVDGEMVPAHSPRWA